MRLSAVLLAALVVGARAAEPSGYDKPGTDDPTSVDVCGKNPRRKLRDIFIKVVTTAGLKWNDGAGMDPSTKRPFYFDYGANLKGVDVDCSAKSVVDGTGNAATRACDTFDMIVVGSALCDMVHSEDEIAFWLSHEVSHLVLGHHKARQDTFVKACKDWVDGEGASQAKGISDKVDQDLDDSIRDKYPDADTRIKKDPAFLERLKLEAQSYRTKQLASRLVAACQKAEPVTSAVQQLALDQEHEADLNGINLMGLTAPPYDRAKANEAMRHGIDYLWIMGAGRDTLHASLESRGDDMNSAAAGFNVK
jgi:hypothetical protein